MSGPELAAPAPGGVRGAWLRRLSAVERSLIIGMTGTVLLNVAQMIVNFALTLALSHLLGARGLGAYAYAFAWSSLLAVPSVLGITPLVVRNVAAYRENESWGLLRGMLARANQAVALSSGLLVAGGAVVALFVNDSKGELLRPVLVGLLLVPIVALTSIRQAAMQGLGRVVLARIPETLVAPAVFLGFIGGAYLVARHSISATWVIGLQAVAFLAAFVLGAAILRRSLPHHAKTEQPEHAMREWVRSALPLLLFSAIQALNAQVEVILLGAIKSSRDAGLFSVAVRASGIVPFVLLAAGYPLSPMIARLHASGETALLRKTVRRAAIGIFVASLPLAVGVVVFARPLLALFGGEFKGGVTALVVLSVGQLVYAAMGLAGTVLVMTGNESWLVKGVIAGAVTNIGLNALLIPPFGLTGAATGSTIAAAVMNGSLVYLARRRARVPSSAFGI